MVINLSLIEPETVGCRDWLLAVGLDCVKRLWVRRMKRLSQENESAAHAFSKKLGKFLKGCLPQSTASLKTQREKMWRNFHSLRVSESFKKLWHEFLKSAGLEVNPLFYRYVSNELIMRQFTLSQVEEPTISPLTYEELRYVAGYDATRDFGIQASLLGRSFVSWMFVTRTTK